MIEERLSAHYVVTLSGFFGLAVVVALSGAPDEAAAQTIFFDDFNGGEFSGIS